MKFLDHTRQEGTCLFEFTGNTDHRQHHPQRPLRRGPCEGTQLNEEDILAEQRQTDAANPQEGIRFPIEGDSGNRLVASGIKRADNDRSPSRPVEQAHIERVLRLLVRQAGALKKEFTANQTDAVANLGRNSVEFLGIGNIEPDLNPLPILRATFTQSSRLCTGSRTLFLDTSPGECFLAFSLRVDDQEAHLGIEQHGGLDIP